MIGLSAGRPHPLVAARDEDRPPPPREHAGDRRRDALATSPSSSERTLYYSSNSPAFVRSHTGLLSILQALAYGVYARDTAQYDDRIRAFRLK